MHPLCKLAAADGRITPTPMSAPLDHSDKRSGIYCIWMPVDPKHRVYVGQSVHVAQRWKAHRSTLRSGTHGTSKLQRAYSKYGEAAWVWALVEEVAAADKAAITAAEQAWMDTAGRDRLFNTAPAAGSTLGFKQSPEHIEKVAAANRGRKHTPEARENMAAARRGRKLSPEHIERRTASQRGRKQTPEHIEARTAARRGRKLSPEHVAKCVATRAANRAAKLAEKG